VSVLKVALLHHSHGGGATTALKEILSWGPTVDVEARWFLAKGSKDPAGFFAELEDWRPDLVHLHCWYGDLPYEWLKPMSAKWPTLLTAHDVFPVNQFGPECWECSRNRWCFGCPALKPLRRIRPNYRTRERARKARIHRASQFTVLCPSQWMKHRLLSTELARHALEVVPYSVDTVRFSPMEVSRRELGVGEEPLVLFAGNMYSDEDHRKGLPDLLRSWPLVRALHPSATLAVAGEISGIAQWPEGVKSLGSLDSDRLLHWLRASDVFCLPSRGDNSPLSVLEAMSCEVPVVATRIGGIPEQLTMPLVAPGRTAQPAGLLASAGDPIDLADQISLLLLDPARRRALGSAGRKRVLLRWSRGASAAAHREAYERACHSHRRSS
jgi:glycosyltransferase involved in cell wall biosynthesis